LRIKILILFSIFIGCVSSSFEAMARGGIGTASSQLSSTSAYPLRPPKLDSPQSTIRSFVRNANEAIGLLQTEQGRDSDAIRRAMRRAMLCLDLSSFALGTMEAVGTEKVLLLKEIIDRVGVPPLEEIPNRQEVKKSGMTSWTIPNTELSIVRMEEGPQAGRFLFSAETVELLEQFYTLAETLPYKPGASIGAYEDYLYGPGTLLPRTWFAGLPAWSYQVIAGQTVWQWIALAILIVIVIVATTIVYRLGRWWDRNHNETGAWILVGRPLTSVFVILSMQFVSLAIDDAINITGIPFIVVELTAEVVTFLAAAWLAVLVISRFGEGIINARHLRSASLNSQLIRTITRLISIVVVIYLGVIAAESFGIPVTPLIAGLGVGGLAIALAVRPTLENIVGGFILFADKPVRVGDFCTFGDKMGTVEEVGLRSTRIRALDRTLISVPNAEFANMQIINWASCDSMLIESTIRLRYETTPDQLRYVLTKFREMFLAHPKIDQNSARIRFVGYGESSQNVSIRVYATTQDWNEFFAIQEDVFLRVGEIVAASGTQFAFPSQTVYFGRDHGLDKNLSADAVRHVQAWRATNQLPFPKMETAKRERLANSLDYPPRGSPDASRTQGEETERAEPLSANTEDMLDDRQGKDG
jgi:MscS family membrane protein